ncbi:MAG: S41 family peptidase [Schleiferiaceae bacterium]|nr:S41 family peptidase [Schleiferiaceae bacterium]
MKRSTVYIPILIAVAMIAGIFLGIKLNYPSKPVSLMAANIREQKIKQIINYIEFEYVDPVDTDSLLDNTIADMLRKLDPHSTYIAPVNTQRAQESIQGSFDGIGIEFQMYRDSITVVKVVPDGPAAKAGLKAGDRIIGVDGEAAVGENASTTDYVSKLKGPRGTKVIVKAYRPLDKEVYQIPIIRNQIPLVSLDAAYMIDDQIGFIRLNRFAETTYQEFSEGLKELKKKGATKLILDLRDNPGGLLTASTKIADEFLKGKQLIVYTEDRNSKTKYTYAKSKGLFLDGDVVVLINEGSASASEIIAGALQDNDRATIIGRRSFGKGLVQEEMSLADGSKIRLTTARYYTPTGRSIQKPYEDNYEAYQSESFKRFEAGELVNKDSIKVREDLRFVTPKGKVVFGGGGIVPDIFVPIDTSKSLMWLYHILGYGRIDQFAFQYIDNNRKDFQNFNRQDFVANYDVSAELLDAFLEQEDLKKYLRTTDALTEVYIKIRLKALMARNLFGNDAFFEVLHQNDPIVERARDVLKNPDFWQADSLGIL